jgi:hypothetical protein
VKATPTDVLNVWRIAKQRIGGDVDSRSMFALPPRGGFFKSGLVLDQAETSRPHLSISRWQFGQV